MMTRIQTQLKAVLTAVLLTTALSASAQEAPENYVPYPYAFIGLQGGGQVTFTDYNNWKLITPTASVSAGMFFTPVVGARLHFNGLWDKGGLWQNDYRYSYNYLNTDLDLMINVINLFSQQKYHPWNVYLIGGVGLRYAWNNEDAWELRQYLPRAYKKDFITHNFRIGAMLEYNIARNWSVNLEVSANSTSDRYNSKVNYKDDWQLTAQLGVAYKFGVRSKKSDVFGTVAVGEFNDAGRSEAIHGKTGYESRIDTVWYDDETIKEEVVNEKMERNIYYSIRESRLSDPQVEIDAVADFVKKHKDCTVTVTGYADKQTGNPTINMKYSKERAEKATKGLIAAGVSASIITTTAKGDTVQPFSENDKNRVVIVVAAGQGTVQKKVTTKKFRLEEKK